jgi:cell division protein ZapA
MEPANKERRQVRVTIANQSFTLLTSGDDREVIDLAQQVDDLISGIAARSTNSDSARIAILACLHLADRLQSTERDMHSIRELFETRAKHIQGLLDQVID